MLVLGADIGTSSLKLGALDLAQGVLVNWNQGAYEPEHPAPGWSELNAERYWQAFVESLDQLKIDRKQVKALAVSSQAQSFVPVNPDGQTLQNLWTWLDNRAAKEAADLNIAITPEEISQTTGLQKASAGLLAAMLKYLAGHQPQIVAQTWKFLFSSSYLIWRLCGRAVADENVAAMSGLYDWHNKIWWPRMVQAAGIRTEQLPEVVPCGTVVGNILPQIARQLELPEDLVIVTGANDQTANALGAGLTGEGSTLIVLGTALVVYRIEGRQAFVIPADAPGIGGPYPISGTGYQLGFTNSGCATVDWVKNLLAPEISYPELMNRLAEIPAGCEGVTWLIDLDGSTTTGPITQWGTVAGLSRKADRWTILRAAVEGVAYLVRELTQRMGWTLGGGEVRVAGGAARSDLWTQILADVLQTPVTRLDHEQSGILGTCIFAAVGANLVAGFGQAVETMVKPGRRFKPDPAAMSQYQTFYGRFCRLRRAGDSFYQEKPERG